MDCVKCDGKLVTVRIDDFDVDQCDACAGIWFDGRELERVLGRKSVTALRKPTAPRSGDDARRGRCPRCRGEGQLVRVVSHTAPIHIDTCAVCGGKWLDGGELELLRHEGLGGALRRLAGWVLDLG